MGCDLIVRGGHVINPSPRPTILLERRASPYSTGAACLMIVHRLSPWSRDREHAPARLKLLIVEPGNGPISARSQGVIGFHLR